jgi:cell wall-associated NlpC family hydrolase
MRGAAITLGALVLSTPLLAGAAVSMPSAPAQVDAVGVVDIPGAYLRDYEASARRFGIDWAVLAAIGKLECDHGRLAAAGCNPQGSVNAAGAVGPMQFLAPTWRAGAQIGTSPAPGPATQTTAEGYASDGDGDGHADVWNAADAIAAAARYLVANGAPGDYRRALLAYNHADWYVARVLEQATIYRNAAGASAGVVTAAGGGDPVAWAARYLGSAYVYGGNHTAAAAQLDATSAPELQVSARDGRVGFFDCSSLASWAFAQTRGVFIGATSEQQWRLAQERSLAGEALVRVDAPPGGFVRDDLLFFEPTPSGPGHVAIAIDQTRMIESPHTGANVRISLISSHSELVGVARYSTPAMPAIAP